MAEDIELIDVVVLPETVASEVVQNPRQQDQEVHDFPVVDPNDPRNGKLRVVIGANEPDAIVQDLLREELAEQIEVLKQLRTKAADGDLAAKAIISEKIILAITKLANMTTQRTKEAKDKGSGVVDFHSENFQAVLTLLTGMIVDAVKETGMQEATAQRFLLKLKNKLVGFEDAAAQAYKGNPKASKEAARNKAAFDKVDPA